MTSKSEAIFELKKQQTKASKKAVNIKVT